MLPRYRETGGMDHMRLDATRRKPARQPKAVAAGFEGQRNPGDRAAGPDRLIPPAMQQSQQPFWARLQLFARLTLNAGKHTGNQPARVAQLDHGNDRAILVQGDEGSAQVVWLGHRGTPSRKCSDAVAMPRRPPHSVSRFRSCERLFWALPIGDGSTKGGATYRFRSETAMRCCHSLEFGQDRHFLKALGAEALFRRKTARGAQLSPRH